jgi:branched-chain amino acid transport system permease protein
VSELLQILLDGLASGVVYAALALALAVVFQGTGMLNFAQGELALIAAYLVFTLSSLGLPVWVAIPGAIVLSGALGAVIYLGIVRFVDARQNTTLLMMGVTLLLGLGAVIAIVWGTDPLPFPQPFGSGVVRFWELRLTAQQIGAILTVGMTLLIVAFVFTKTDVGLRLRAVAQNRASAALLGLSAIVWITGGWIAACMVGAVAGAVAAPILGLSPSMMTLPLLMALAATNLGGIGSRVGVVIGGLLIGELSAIGARYVPGLGFDLSVLFAFAVVIVIVMIKPAGLFGRESTVRA